MNKLQHHEEKAAENDYSAAKETSKKYFQRFWKIISHYSGFNELDGKHSKKERDRKPSPALKRTGLLFILQIVPWLLAACFVFSFYWDFDNRSVFLFGTYYPLDGILRIITVSGLIGFLTNWTAITMLFRPSRKHPLLGHGLIPAHKERIAYRLAYAVSEDLINPEIIKQKIHESQAISRYREKSIDWLKSIIDDPGFRDDLKIWVVEYSEEMIADPELRANLAKHVIEEIDEELVNRSLEKAALKAYSFLRGKEMQEIIEDAIAEIPASVEKGLNKLDAFLNDLPGKLDQQADAIEEVVTTLLYRLINQLDVQALVEDNLKSYDEARLEAMIRGATNEQLRYIQYLGAVLGTIGGFVIWQPVISLSAIAILFTTVFAADFLITKFQGRNL